MMRATLVCLAALGFAEVGSAEQFIIRKLGGEEKHLSIQRPETVTRDVVEQRVRIVDGKQVIESVKVPVQETRMMQKLVPLKELAIHDLDGIRIAPEKVDELFRKPRMVVLSATAKISPALKEVLKEGTLIVVTSMNAPSVAPK